MLSCPIWYIVALHGAGKISVSESCHYSTGGACGFSFGVEWGRFGFAGGILGRDEAKRMAEFILEKCSEVEKSEAEELLEIESQIFKSK